MPFRGLAGCRLRLSPPPSPCPSPSTPAQRRLKAGEMTVTRGPVLSKGCATGKCLLGFFVSIAVAVAEREVGCTLEQDAFEQRQFFMVHGSYLSCSCLQVCPLYRDALDGKGPWRRPQKWLGRRLEEVTKAVGGGYCRLQMPLKAGTCHQGAALEGATSLPFNASLPLHHGVPCLWPTTLSTPQSLCPQ